MFGFLIDIIARLFLIFLAAVCVFFFIAVAILSIGEKNDWWNK